MTELVKEVMSPKASWIEPNTKVTDAARQMKQEDIGFLPIGENDRLIGVVTDRDITTRVVGSGKDPSKTSVREVMSKGVSYCFEEDNVEKAVENMCKNKIHRLIVLNDKKRMTGILALRDLATRGHEPHEAIFAHLVESIKH
jgi:CBS domain-containing protein